MVPHMTVIGMMESSKKGYAHIPMENYMKGNGSKENLTELESRHGLTVANMMARGEMVNNTAWEHTQQTTENQEWENGRKERE